MEYSSKCFLKVYFIYINCVPREFPFFFFNWDLIVMIVFQKLACNLEIFKDISYDIVVTKSIQIFDFFLTF